MYVWTASSAGARGAIGDLAKKFAKKRVNPIVKLSTGSYKHAQYGKVQVPVLEIVGWEAPESTPLPPVPGPSSPKPSLAGPAGGAGPQAAVFEEIDDSIPF